MLCTRDGIERGLAAWRRYCRLSGDRCPWRSVSRRLLVRQGTLLVVNSVLFPLFHLPQFHDSVLFSFSYRNRLMCVFWRVLYAITTKVTHVFVRGKRACRSLSFCRADSGSTVRLLYIPIILLLPAPNAKNIKAGHSIEKCRLIIDQSM